MKVETAIKQTEGAIGFYADEVFKLAGEKPDHNELSLKAERIVAALNRYLEFLKADVLPRARRELADRSRTVRSQARARAGRRADPRPSGR